MQYVVCLLYGVPRKEIFVAKLVDGIYAVTFFVIAASDGIGDRFYDLQIYWSSFLGVYVQQFIHDWQVRAAIY